MTLPESSKRSRNARQDNYHMFSLWAQEEWGVNPFNLVAREKTLSGGIHNYIAISQNLPYRISIFPSAPLLRHLKTKADSSLQCVTGEQALT
jgi:hypothetical protein